MKPVFEEFDNWVNGITTSPAPDMLPFSFSPRGRNTILKNLGQGTASVGTRPALALVNPTPVSGSPVILGQYQLRRIDGTKIHLVVSDGGRLDKVDSATTTAVVNAAAFTAGTLFPAFATVNNMAVIANGTDLKKTDGSTVWRVGMVRPAAPVVVATAGGAMSAGDWDVAQTYINSVTGEESSLSDYTTVTLGGGNLQLTASWTAPTDTQVDFVRVYLRKQTLGANAYLAISGTTPASNVTWGAFAVSVVSAVVNVTDTVFGALKIIAPSITENDPPAVTLQFPVFHNSRLFLFDTGNAYYSNITALDAHPESFDPNNIQPINPSDGDVIMGAISEFGRLFIYKKYSLWVIDGYDPASWTVTRVSAKHGLGSHRTLCSAAGTLYWWTNSSIGPVSLAPGLGSVPLELGKLLIAPSVDDMAVNTLALRFAIAEVDETRELILFAVPGAGSASRNTIIFPFNYRNQRFVSDGWNPMDIASMAVVQDAASTKTVYAGGYSGQVFSWGAGTNDGVVSGTGAGLVTGQTTTTLVDSLAAFNTTGGKLVERYVYHIPLVGPVQRRRITANTGTTLTVVSAWDQTLVVGDSYIIGGIDWQLDTPWMKAGAAFYKKRFEFLFLEATSDYNSVVVSADIFTRDDTVTPKKTLTFTLSNPSAVYDTAVYDTAVYASPSVLSKRLKVGLTGKSYMVRLRQLQQDKQVLVKKVAMQSSVLSSRT